MYELFLVFIQIGVFYDKEGVVEMIIENYNIFTIRVHNMKEKSFVVTRFARLDRPPLTFFQKYGNFIMMGVMVIVQVLHHYLNLTFRFQQIDNHPSSKQMKKTKKKTKKSKNLSILFIAINNFTNITLYYTLG